MNIVAHRGASDEAPENTLAAVELAWQQDADAVEVDVYLSRDGRIVVIHDDTIRRTAGVDGSVAERTLAELKTLDVGRWKGDRWIGQRIPTLEEVLAAVPQGKRLLVEVKCGPQIIPELQRILDADARPVENAAILCFDRELCAEAKRAIPHWPVFWLLKAVPKRDPQSGQVVASWTDCIDQCLSVRLDGLSVARDSLLSEDIVRQVHAAGLQLHVWTVNSAEEARRLADAGVDTITTDRPGWLRGRLRSGGEPR